MSVRTGWGWVVIAALAVSLLPTGACSQPTEPVTGSTELGASPADLGAGVDLAQPHAPLRELRTSDVTLVYPLPAPSDISALIAGNTMGRYGRLVPLSAFVQIKFPLDPRPFSVTKEVGAAAWNNLRVVAVRVDPCADSRGDIPDASCRGQVRLVFQGVHVFDSQSTAGDDGAVHVLYEVPRPELVMLMRDLFDLTEHEGSYAPAPLGVHPILKRQGVRGSFAQKLKTLLLDHLGESRVSRLTFIVRANNMLSAWRLGFFDRKSTGFEPQVIATTQVTEQQLLLSLPTSGDIEGSTPTPTESADNLTALLSGTIARAVTETERQSAFTAALRIENPRRHTPDTIDCLSCHVAMATRTFAEQRLGLVSTGHPDLFTATGDLRFDMPKQPSLENIHALSYLSTELGINHRTTNDSAQVAESLTALLRKLISGQ